MEFYIGRNYLKEHHYSEIRSTEYTKEFDKARVKAIRTNDNILEGPFPTNPQSEYAKRYKNIIDEFKSTNKLAALLKLPHVKMWCER